MRCSWVYLVYGSNNSYYKLQISEIAKVYTAIGWLQAEQWVAQKCIRHR
jgi:hypothetical protein